MMMRYLFLFLLWPIIAHAQNDSDVVYKKSYVLKNIKAAVINEHTKDFIQIEKGKFFYISSYSKKKGIDKSIDTSNYGNYRTNGNTVTATCVFMYMTNSVDVVTGDIVFTANDNEASMRLQNVMYGKYEKEDGRWRETLRGNYKDLKLCRHCNVTGIKLAETVNKGFVRLSLAYEKFIKSPAAKGVH